MKYFNIILPTITAIFFNSSFAADLDVDTVGGGVGPASSSALSPDVCSEGAHLAANLVPGLNADQSRVYLAAVRDYTIRLNSVCRYPREGVADGVLYESLPAGFFEFTPLEVYFRLGVPFSASLASLIENSDEPLVDGERRIIIECRLAFLLTKLQGARAVLDNDDVFNRLCVLISQKHQRNGTISVVEFDRLFFNEHGCASSASGSFPGSWVGLVQLDELHYFNPHPGLNDRAVQQAISVERTLYCIKHPESSGQSLNMIMLGAEQCVFFNPGLYNPVSLIEAAGFLVDEMHKEERTIDSLQLYHQAAATALSGLTYSDRGVAAHVMVQRALYSVPSFPLAFHCANFVARYHRDWVYGPVESA